MITCPRWLAASVCLVKTKCIKWTTTATTISCLIAASIAVADAQSRIDLDGISIAIESAGRTAGVDARVQGKFDLRITVHPGNESGNLTMQVKLPATGPKTWSAELVHVLNDSGSPVLVSRSGIEWHELQFTVPPTEAHYYVRARQTTPPNDNERLPRDSKRVISDPTTAVSAKICRWFNDKQAALSIRFDDSHPTHLSVAVPLLDEYGLRGTFMINPGRSDFQSHQPEWEAIAKTGRHEFDNHSSHHRGAMSDLELAREIGDAAQYIWSLFPDQSRIVALNLGGGTTIKTKEPLQTFLDQYHVFPVTGSLGMDDVYGNRPSALRRKLEREIKRGLWCKIHFHSIGPNLATSKENFVAEMDIVREYSSKIWVTGLASAYKFQRERDASALSLISATPREFVFQLTCLTDPALYDQPLTLEIALPETAPVSSITVTRHPDAPVAFTQVSAGGEEHLLRLNIPPVSGRYNVRY
jgi:Polysaccharide deacetylase